jgi:hypothetical protein
MSAEPEYGDALIFAGRILHDLIRFLQAFLSPVRGGSWTQPVPSHKKCRVGRLVVAGPPCVGVVRGTALFTGETGEVKPPRARAQCKAFL